MTPFLKTLEVSMVGNPLNVYRYPATLIRVVDGDTVHVQISYGMKIWAEKTLRLAGINAPEMSTPKGPVAKDHLRKLLASPGKLWVLTPDDHLDKYGRNLAWLEVSDKTAYLPVNAQMVADGMAVLLPPLPPEPAERKALMGLM